MPRFPIARRVALVTSVLLFLNMLTGCSRGRSTAQQPRLVVFLVVDQMRPDYLNRFAGDFQGGLKTLRENSVRFTHAFHDHAFTETAVGHTTLLTGVYPRHHGIVANRWFDHQARRVQYCTEDEQVHLLTDSRHKGQSPRRLMHPTLGDLLKAQSPRSKVYSIALKDRAAILMGGKHPDGAFWYDKKHGLMTTSSYYMETLPQWVQAFNQQHLLDRYFGQGWDRLRGPEVYNESREDDFPREADGKHTTFPHRLGVKSSQPDEHFYEAIYSSPFGDEFVLQFARRVITSQELGRDEVPDLLLISCSAADVIGHRFGPYSQEVQDYYLRLDEYLEALLNFLDEQVGRDHYRLILSADHAVLPMPEQLVRQGIQARRVDERVFKEQVRRTVAKLTQRFGVPAQKAIASFRGGLTFQPAFWNALGADSTRFKHLLKVELEKLEPVAACYWATDLRPSDAQDPFARLYWNNRCPDRTADLLFRFQKYWLVTRYATGTTHGSPYEYDAHVPLLFYGAGFGSRVVDQRVSTVDVVPTVADWLGLSPSTAWDGKPMNQWLVSTK